MARRMTISIVPHDVELLKQLYLEFGIPLEQYEKHPEDFIRFMGRWTVMSGRSDDPGDILHYMRTKRKAGEWVTFGGNHRISPPLDYSLSREEGITLVSIYEQVFAPRGIRPDSFSYDSALAGGLTDTFAHETARVIPGSILASILIDIRKDGSLPRMGRGTDGDGDGGDGMRFGDIDQITG